MANKEATETKAADEPKFTVEDLVEATELQPASVRVALRELGVEKEFGNKYGWRNEKDFNEVVKAMKERSAKRVVTPQPKKAEPAPVKGKEPAKAAPKKAAPATAAKGGKKKAA